jgi:hypothetical protein
MIGRKVTENDHMLDAAASSGQHILSTDVFHESGEKFSKAVIKDEGVLKHYMRHIYMVFGLITGVSLLIKAY